MAHQMEALQQRIVNILAEYEFDHRQGLLRELGVRSLFDITQLSIEDMKKIHEFTYIEQRKLLNIQIECCRQLNINTFKLPICPVTPSHSLFSEQSETDTEAHSFQSKLFEEPSSLDLYQSLTTEFSGTQQPVSLSGYTTPPTQEPSSDPDVYPVLRNKAGFTGVGMLILNRNYKSCVRLGVQQDENLIREVYTNIGLYLDDSLVFVDERSSDLLQKIEKTLGDLTQLLEETSCLFVAVSSHGSEDAICCVDDTQISVTNEFLPLFKNDRCKALLGKPKVFLLQTCRGEKVDFEVTADYVGEDISGAKQLRSVHTIETDIILGYASVYTYSALRDFERGSWYFQAFREAYFRMKSKDFCDIFRVLTLTNYLMVSEFEYKTRKQPSQFTSCLTRVFILPKNEVNF